MCRYRCLMVRVEKNTAQWEPPLGVSKLDKAYAAATLSNGLEFIRLDLPDGTRWVLGEGAIGRPFMARLVLANQGNRPIRIWDPNESEGSSCRGLCSSTGTAARRS